MTKKTAKQTESTETETETKMEDVLFAKNAGIKIITGLKDMFSGIFAFVSGVLMLIGFLAAFSISGWKELAENKEKKSGAKTNGAKKS